MPNETVSRDTVNIDESLHEIYQQLTEGADPISVPFRTMKDVFMWAVSLGFQRGERRPLSGKRVTIFRWAQFTSQADIPLLKAVALADRSEVDILLEHEEILSIAEEYANAGIHDLRTSVLDDYSQPLWNLTNLIAK